MKDRIAYIIKEKNITKTKFAETLNVSSAFVSQICSGVREPSDRTLNDICTKFGVNPVWLRTGVGEPFTPLSRSQELAAIFAAVQVGDDAKSRLIKAMARMPDEAFPKFLEFLEGLHEQLKE